MQTKREGLTALRKEVEKMSNEQQKLIEEEENLEQWKDHWMRRLDELKKEDEAKGF